MEEAIQRLKEIAKREWQKNLQTLARMRAEQAAEAKAAEDAKAAAANIPPAPADTVPIEGLHFVNGRIVNKPAPAPSAAVAKGQQFSDWNEHARQNVRR